MILPGCLLAIGLPLGGAALGRWLDGSEGGLWGLAIGFVLGCALAALSGWLLARMKGEYGSLAPAVPGGFRLSRVTAA